MKRILSIIMAVMLIFGVVLTVSSCSNNTNNNDNDVINTDNSGSVSNDNDNIGEKTLTIIITHKDGSVVTKKITTQAQVLGKALIESELASGDSGEYGLFITTVDGETANADNEEWWCITKGGESVMTGVDSTPIANGDTFEFTLTVGY